jgi:orotidine-5'-phosphate decarboxylase
MAETVGAERVIVALDRPDPADNLELVELLKGHATWFKVGMREYYGAGDRLLGRLRELGANVFLDLKLHDIPETVKGASQALAYLRPALATVHASGGAAMIRAAVEGFGPQTQVLAVTVLTSLAADDAAALGWQGDIPATATRWARIALEAGAAGVVCSGHEVAALRALHPGALLVTPGVRPAGAATGDQARVVTPAAAITSGASYIVVGRPIHGAPDPLAAFRAIAAEKVG